MLFLYLGGMLKLVLLGSSPIPLCTSWIMLSCCSLDWITNRFSSYVIFPLVQVKYRQARRKLTLLPLFPLILGGYRLYLTYSSISFKSMWCHFCYSSNINKRGQQDIYGTTEVDIYFINTCTLSRHWFSFIHNIEVSTVNDRISPRGLICQKQF